MLFVAAAGHVVLEQPPPSGVGVVAGEQRHDCKSLHGGRKVVAHHLTQLVGLALQADGCAFDLLVVLELQLEQPDHLHRRSRGAGDRDARVAICRKHLLDAAVADEVA